MPLAPDDKPASLWPSRLVVAALVLAGYGLTVLVFYPGVMTYDAKFVYEDIAKNVLGDWQSPAMTVLWRFIDPAAPGPASMFLLIVTAYWLAFAVLAMALVRHAMLAAVLLPLLALTPPAFVFVGIIWRDVLFSVTWLLAASLAFAAAGRGAGVSLLLQALALALCGFGVLLRPNALIAAPLLAAYIVWPDQFNWKRMAIAFVPAIFAFFALVQLVYYGALGATRQHPLQSIMVFDLGGISHFAQANQFPVRWNDAETALLLNGCYKPTEWDIYWRLEPCEFVMHKLEKEEHLFGTAAVTSAWASAILRHPIAYLEHRSAFMWNFLAGSNLTMWVTDVDDPAKTLFADRPAFVAVKAIHETLKPTPLFRAASWLLICIAICAFGWTRRDRAEGAYMIGVCGSAVAYVLTFYAVGVASDFRYAYWAVLASLTGGVVAAVTRRSAKTALSRAA
ncbi:MAG TPA: hypothetical protein VIV34_11570 [Pseudolabrys sp.]